MRSAIALFLLLAGCAHRPTLYHPLADDGGFYEAQLDPTTWRVGFAANDYTSLDNVEIYLHRRCAELTHEQRFEWFRRVDGRISSSSSSTAVSSPFFGSVVTQGYSSTAYKAVAVIRIGNGAKPEDAYDAREVLRIVSAYGNPPPPPPPRKLELLRPGVLK